MTISSSVPELVKVDNSFGWKLGVKGSRSVEQNRLEWDTETIPVSVQPRTKLVGKFEWYEGMINKLDFKADYLLTFYDNT